MEPVIDHVKRSIQISLVYTVIIRESPNFNISRHVVLGDDPFYLMPF